MKMTEFDAVDLMKKMTMVVTVSRLKEMKIRFWIGIQLIKLAAKICNMGIAINESHMGLYNAAITKGQMNQKEVRTLEN